MGMPGPVELLIMAGVIIVLFGSRKLPEAARSMGRSMRIFKSEVRGLHDDDRTASLEPVPVAVPASAPASATVPAAATVPADLPVGARRSA